MFFTAGRNEAVDLIGNQIRYLIRYQIRYLTVREAINEQMKLYAICNEDFNDIEEQINNMEHDAGYECDPVAPCTQNLDEQDQAEGDVNLHPDLNETYNRSDDIGIPSSDAKNEPLILNELQDNVYREMV